MSQPTALRIGGTRNLGPDLAAALLQAGFHLTILNRGITQGPPLDPQIERLYADDLELLDRHGIECAFVPQGDLDVLEEPVRITVYRMVQECLSNIARHSSARHAAIRLVRSERVVEVRE